MRFVAEPIYCKCVAICLFYEIGDETKQFNREG